MMSTRRLTLLLPLVVAACAGGAPSGQTTPAGSPSAPAAPPGSETSVEAPPSSTAPVGTAPEGVVAPTGTTRPIAATEMASSLQALGLDVKALPPLNKVPPDKIRKVMGTFTKALGVKCTGCHDGDDFKKPTPNKKIAERMWNEFVRGYTLEGGGAVYCDSCHGGHAEFLVRDPGLKGLSDWMDENYVQKLKRTNGEEHSCETCHGDPMEGKFLKSWAK